MATDCHLDHDGLFSVLYGSRRLLLFHLIGFKSINFDQLGWVPMRFRFLVLFQTNNAIVLQRFADKSIKNSHLNFRTQSRIIESHLVAYFALSYSIFLDHDNALDDDSHTADNANHRNRHWTNHDNQKKCSTANIDIVLAISSVLIVAVFIIAVVVVIIAAFWLMS